MMGLYKVDRTWSDKYIPHVKRLIGHLLLEEADYDNDTKFSTDLIILKARDMRIAVRIRRFDYAERYGNEFTIRSHRDSGYETELSKIVSGWGDWLFYGFAKDNDCNQVGTWHLLDLNSFRHHIAFSKKIIKYAEMNNNDGTKFYSFKIDSFPTDKHKLIIAP